MAILFQDDFNRADGDLGANWTTDVGGYSIVSNAARRPGTAGFEKLAWVDTDGLALRADMNVQCRLRRTSINDPVVGLGARRTAINTFYAFHIQSGSASIRLFKLIGGVFTQLASAATSDTTNFHKFRLEVFGDQLKVFRDNVLILGPITDNSITAAGSGGILGEQSTPSTEIAHFDDFFIGDESGDMIPGQISIDNLTPLLIRTTILMDKLIPLLLKLNENYDKVIPILWDLCRDAKGNTLLGKSVLGAFELGGGFVCTKATVLIPLLYRIRTTLDSVIPIQWGFDAALKFDLAIAILWRILVEADIKVPVQYSLFSDWIKQAASQSDVFTKQVVSETDAWAKQGASQASVWTPE